MPLPQNFPTSPYDILEPSVRWYPWVENLLADGRYAHLPPLVQRIREEIFVWRAEGYAGVSETSRALLIWWFQTEHIMYDDDGSPYRFEYYFAQREALETVIYLYEVKQARDKYALLRYDGSGAVSTGMFDEDWTRYVVKMATGAGKTKVMSLVLAWCYFHRLYEEDSTLARNFLVIAPNIIVLDRIRTDFDGLRIFFADPVLPDNGYMGKYWRDDFQLTLHIQDEVGVISDTGNIFLTNIHRVYDSSEVEPTFEDEDTMDYFLGRKPVGKTNESRVDLGDIVRGIDELVVINDEAHHIHDDKLAWFSSIRDITYQLRQKGRDLSLQLDVTATPKKQNGAVFPQVISDYPLVEAIHQRVVKTPIIPDDTSRARLEEHASSVYSERYRDYIHLGYEEWKKTYYELLPTGKKSILFVMTDDTKNCDDVANYLEHTYPEFAGSVLTIHTKSNGDVSESDGKKEKEELERLRKLSREIDDMSSPYKVVVSVLMLREWWDVKNVTTIVGLRAFSSKSDILPEQTLGRGLRRMFRGQDIEEKVSIIGTEAFMEFVRKIEEEWVSLEWKDMSGDSRAQSPIVIEVDIDNPKKDLVSLDIEIPILTPRIRREYKNLELLGESAYEFTPLTLKAYAADEEVKEIVFTKAVTGEHDHTVELVSVIPNATNVVGYLAGNIMKELRLFSGYSILYGKVKSFIQYELFSRTVDLENIDILKNLAELESQRTIAITFRKAINSLTVVDTGSASLSSSTRVAKTRPFVVKEQAFLIPRKSVFNKIIGDSLYELEFASFLEDAGDIISYAKNYFGIEFKIDYQNTDGSIANYYPDFFVKQDERTLYIIELKWREDLDDILKVKRLFQYCEDANKIDSQKKYIPLYIKQEDWDKYRPKSFEGCVRIFWVPRV